ncbi:MAG TPA: ABC transporter substrate-binding protein [Chloroflexota bacterium]|jgi:4,5-dihydroxyphthalate decarboxylase|nr:ABC transporter substrate-binding protein [Chloroflexota bacterium]
MANLPLTLACGPYDRTLALRDGTIRPDGIELTYIARQPSEIFWRMLQYQEFDVAEMSLSNYATLVSRGDPPFVGLPVFPSRGFRHAYIFIHADSGIRAPADLAGKRGGVPEYSQTAAVYIRGLLQHEYGVQPTSIEWVQGRADRFEHPLPADLRLRRAPPGAELNDLLDRHEIDFLITANNPLSFRRGLPHVQRLFPNYKPLEQDYYRRTRIFPIMHLVVVRRDIYEQHPWVALSLYQAFCAAKERCYRLLEETGSLKATLAWLQPALEEEKALLGPDWWPYGLEASRPALEALLQYAWEQGLLYRPVQPEELFAPSTLRDIPLGEGQLV